MLPHTFQFKYIMKFTDLNIAEPILKALREKGYVEPTPVQEKAIPPILKGRDVLACAQTGTGKTAAFALPIVQRVLQVESTVDQRTPSPRALIVTPTRELAIQIDENVASYGKYTNLKHTVIFGGVKQGKQVDRLRRGVDILTATPGRLLDLIDQGLLKISDIEFFVLDEADRMLDMGFVNDVKKIIRLIPKERQSLFFSATMPNNIVKLAKEILTNEVRVEVAPPSTTAETIEQYLYYTNKPLKRSLLKHIIEDWSMDQVLVFSRTKHGADRIARDLKKADIKAAPIHGDKPQNFRQKVLKQFKEGTLQVLVATDIAARGIDIDKLKYVINFDIPNVAETYVHRIGRSGRAGEEGTAISICEPEENAYIRDIEKLIGLKIEVKSDHPFEQTDTPMTAAEKKEFEKEKQRKKQEFFANRKKKRQEGGGQRGNRNGGGGRNNNSKRSKDRSPADKKRREENLRAADGGGAQKPKSQDKNKAENNSEGGGQKRKNNKKRRNNNSRKRESIPTQRKSKNDSRTELLPKSLKDKYMFPLE
jgi:ATP-dependent RNA helicase RhlE